MDYVSSSVASSFDYRLTEAEKQRILDNANGGDGAMQMKP